MGRADQTTKVRGMFVHPEQVARVAKRHPEVRRLRLVIGSLNGRDTALLRCKADPAAVGLDDAIRATLSAECRVSAGIALQPPGSLPNAGQVKHATRRPWMAPSCATEPELQPSPYPPPFGRRRIGKEQ